MTLHMGQSLGRYHLTAQLGEGGMATVYKAYDTRLERDVAIKIIRSEQFSSTIFEQFLKRFEREAKALAKLNHPNIIPIIDYGEELDKPYLVMPYLPGGTLAQRLDRPFPWQTAVQLLLPIARALAYAHQHGTIHRDVKPSNILITESNEPMLTDFGIAKILENEPTTTLTGAGVGIGTPEYMAPEQGLGKPIDGRADLYSLGVVLYEMVTGRKPYIAETPLAVVLKHLTEPLPPPRAFVHSLPEAMEKVIIKALMKNPDDRYENMQAFIRVLESLLESAGDVAPTQIIITTEAPKPTLALLESAWEKTQRVGEGAASLDESATLKRAPSSFSLGRKTIQWIGIAAAVGILLLLVWLGQTNRASGERPTASSGAISMTTLTPAAVNTSLPTTAAAFLPTPEPLATTPTYLQPLEAISPNNIDRVAQLARWGKGEIHEITYSPDGKLFAVASSLGIYLLDAETLNETGFLETNARVESIAFSSDSKILAAGSQDHIIRLWNIADLTLWHQIEEQKGWTEGLAFSPDGTILASASSDPNVFLWNVADGSLIRSLDEHPSSVRSVSFSPDGKTLAAASGNIVQLWDVEQGTKLFQLEGHTDEVSSALFSPDGSLLASGADDKTVRLWRALDGDLLSTFEGLPGGVTELTFSPNGLYLAASTGYKNAIRLWNVSEKKLVYEISKDNMQYVQDIAFSADGNSFASAETTTISIWRVSDGKLLDTLDDFTNFVNSLAFSPQGTTLAASYPYEIRLWQVSDGAILQRINGFEDPSQSLAYSPDGEILASGGYNQIQLWGTIDWLPLHILRTSYDGYIREITFSPDGTLLASGSSSGAVRLWDIAEGALINELKGATNDGWGIASSPDGNLFAATDGDNVRLWKSDGTLLYTLQGHDSRVWDIAFAPDGALLASASHDHSIRLWRVSDGTLARTLQGNGNVYSVAFSPDGKLLVAGLSDMTIQFWRVSDGALLRTLGGVSLGPGEWMWRLAFSHDGKLLASGASDGVIRLWGVAP